ncbi:MAG TPA: ABC transporter permease subunit [Gemmataceae bacterium]|nr:ABC transporter permease subunit [Gemmataceae bacterium]
MSWLVGPIFVLECVLAARRWQTYAMRTAFLSLLLLSLIAARVWWVADSSRNSLGRMGEAFFLAMAGTQLIFAMLIAPAYFAGRICLEKTRGTLLHMLVTDLSAREIVLGKLGALGSLVTTLILAGVPVTILCTFLGGIDPEALIGGVFVTFASTALVSAVAIVLSVWGRKPHEVLVAAYLFIAIWLLAWPVWDLFAPTLGMPPAWVKAMNPFAMVFGNYAWSGGLSFGDYALYVGTCGGFAMLLTLSAVLSLRWAVCREVVHRPWRWSLPRLLMFSPRLDTNPVLWREWRRRPSMWLRIIWGIYAIVFLGTGVLSMTAGSRNTLAFVNAFSFSTGLLLVGLTSVASLFEERANGSLDILLTTPLSTASIVWGKWLAGYRVLLPVSLLSLLLAFFASFRADHNHGVPLFLLLAALVAAYGIMVNSLGLALSTFIARLGVAMGVTAAIYLTLTAGPILILITVHGHESGFYSISPWWGVGETTVQIERHIGDEAERVAWKIFWIAAYLGAAILLHLATVLNFDRCMGRVPARS